VPIREVELVDDKEGSRRGVAVVHECTLVDRSILWKKEPLISPEARAYVPRAVRPTSCTELPIRKKRSFLMMKMEAAEGLL